MAKARQLHWLGNGKYIVLAVVLGLAGLGWSLTRVDSVSASDPGADWPMWGGRPDRNMVSKMKGLPVTWDVGEESKT